MNTDDNIGAPLSFGTAIDMSGFDEGAKQIEERVSEIGDVAEAQSARINELLTNIPTVNIDIVTNASESLAQIQEGFDEIDYVVETNKAAVKELEAEYATLATEIKKAEAKGDTKEAARLKEQSKAVKENIAIRKKVIEEAGKEADKLAKVEASLKKEANEAKKSEAPHESLRQRLRELKDELVAMEAAGQRNTERYRQIQAEAAKLTDAWSDATKQASILAHDQKGFQGVISGLSGVSGAFTAAQGAVSLFSGENEELQKVMLKVQSLMAITMGLQQLQATLDKDSAFRLVTLNGLKEYWAKLLAIGRGEMVAETAANAANTAAEVSNAEATTAEAVAKEAKAAAAGGAAGAEVVDTAATGANAVAATAGTAANIGLAGAFRMVGAAIKSIPVFGWIAAAIGAIIGVVSHFVKKSMEAKEALKEQREMLKDSNKAYIEAKVAINDNITALERFNGTKAQEKKIVSDLNTKYGETLGYHQTRAEWLDVLKSKGEAYCQTMLMEAKAQAFLNKYTEAYIELMDVKAQAENGEFKRWWRSRSADDRAAAEAISDAEKNVKKWEDEYNKLQEEIAQFKTDNGLDFHPQSNFDPQKASLEIKKSLDEYKASAKKYIQDAQNELTQLTIDAQMDGLGKELMASRVATDRRLEEWDNQLRSLARQRKELLKAQYMNRDGATESGWERSSAGKKTEDDYMQDILNEGGDIAQNYYRVRQQIVENGEANIAAITKRYNDNLIDEFGTTTQKLEKLEREWFERFASNSIPPEFLDNAVKKMEEEIASLKSEGFKDLIDWESVFGDLGDQSIQSLRMNLERVRSYFEQNKESMGATEIKDYTEAIKKMEDEIASRNPFEAMHKSLKDIGTAKTELVNALNEMAAAQGALTEAQIEYNTAQETYNQLRDQVESGELAEDDQSLIDAQNALAEAQNKVNQAEERGIKAENNVIKGRNNLTNSYRNFATQLKNCGSVIGDVGTKAKNLASVFSSDVASSIEKGIDFMDEVIDAASSVINAISDVGKGAATGIEAAVQASATGSTAAAAAGATAISTIEKASVILTVISAALQMATAIANLFNSDGSKQKKIDALDKRINQLKWELNNMDVTRFNEKFLNTLEEVKRILSESTEYVKEYSEEYQQAAAEAAAAWQTYYDSADDGYNALLYQEAQMAQARADAILQTEAEKEAVERLADAFVDVKYAATRALGSARYDNARKMIENYSEQIVLLQEKIDEEQGKKDPDEEAIQKWKNEIKELGFEASSVLADMVDEIIGASAVELSSQLGDAFIEAARQGEDAMEAWHKKVNDIVADVVKRMLIQKFIEEPMGELFNKMQKKWFVDGEFQGIQAVIDSSQEFADGLNKIGNDFQDVWDNLPDDVKEWFGMDEREANQRGIATASQDSVDENNARLTTIQGHTYTLVQGLEELNGTANEILVKVTGIEANTNETNNKLDSMGNRVRNIESTVDDIYRNGIKIKS